MALDGILVRLIADELKSAENSHIEKIHQPSKDELVISLRSKTLKAKLLISAVQGQARVCFTENKFENPENPPKFCMLLRKHLAAAKLTSVQTQKCERIIFLNFSTLNELGDTVTLTLAAELIGNAPNIILINNNNKIIDALHRFGGEGAKRDILPGAAYVLPQSADKSDIFEKPFADVFNSVLNYKSLVPEKALINAVLGFSPLICREISKEAGVFNAALGELDSGGMNSVEKNLKAVIAAAKSGGTPTLVVNEKGEAADFTYINILQYGTGFKNIPYKSYSELLEAFYAQKSQKSRISYEAADIRRLIKNITSRIEHRKNNRILELQKCENREQLRIFGELIKANIHLIEPGASKAQVINYYSPNGETVTVPLDITLNAAGNAAKYFKEYKKSCTAAVTLADLIEKDKQELIYIASVSNNLERANELSDIRAIRRELSEAGYIKATPQKKKVAPDNKYLFFTSPSGFSVAVGKNNLQNDYLTLVESAKTDLWFHIKNFAGSHTVIFCRGKEPLTEDIVFAATVCAKHSKAANSSKAEVDYTQIKYVKKPHGAKPGMVIYTHHKTVIVNPTALNY